MQPSTIQNKNPLAIEHKYFREKKNPMQLTTAMKPPY